MNSVLNRISSVFSFFTTVATVMAAAIAITSLVSTPTISIKDTGLQLHNVQVVKGRPHYYTSKKEEFAHIKFDLDIDLSTLFAWNTKQIFLYITATYPSAIPNAPASRSIIWDAILPHPLAPEHHNTYVYPSTKKSSSSKSKKLLKKKPSPPAVPGLLRLSGQKPKYQITDASGKLAGRGNATLELNWNVQPWVGALQWRSGGLKGYREEEHGWVDYFLGSWKKIDGRGAETVMFDLPELQERGEAAKAAGKEGLGVDKGGERNRLLG